jgi:hypothetical protein
MRWMAEMRWVAGSAFSCLDSSSLMVSAPSLTGMTPGWFDAMGSGTFLYIRLVV